MTGARESLLLDAVNLLLDSRRTLTPIVDLPEPLRPVSQEEAYWVQDRLAEAYGPIGGWKVGAPTAEAEPIFAPMPAAWVGPDASLLGLAGHRFRGLEAEVAFLLGHDLPPRSQPYSAEECAAAIQSCHPAIEVIESALSDPTDAAVTRLSMVADLQMHGGFVYGPAYANWQQVDFSQERVTLVVDGSVRLERTGSNTAGDLRRLLPWLANRGAMRTGGLRAGQWITTGSWTGCTPAMQGSDASVHFSILGSVSVRFE